MSETGIVYILIFALITVAAFSVQFFLHERLQPMRRSDKRYAALETGAQTAQRMDVLRKKRTDTIWGALTGGVQLRIVKAGLTLTPFALVVRGAFFCAVLTMIMPTPQSLSVRLVVASLVTLIIFHGYLTFQSRRRTAQFVQQLPEVIDVIVRSLRAGHPLSVSFARVAREMAAPAGPAFSAVVDELNYGRSVADALDLLEKRIDYREVRFLVSSIAIAQQTGGNLAEILARLAKMLRERMKLKRKVRALSAEGRFSGYALSSLPVILFGLINLVSPPYYQELWQSPVRLQVFLVAGGLLLVGNFLIFRMVNFKV